MSKKAPLEKWFKFLDKHPTYVVKLERIGGPYKLRFTCAHARNQKKPRKARGEVIGLDLSVFPDPASIMLGIHRAILDTGREMVEGDYQEDAARGAMFYVPEATS